MLYSARREARVLTYPRRRFAWSWAAVATTMLAAGCGQILGVDDFRAAPPPSRNTGDGDAAARVTGALFDFDRAGCSACTMKYCEPEARACVAEPTCQDFWSCRAACAPDDLTCENTCRTRSWPWGGGAYRARQTGEFEACLAQHCESTCTTSHVLGQADCARCAATSCTDVDWQKHAASVAVQHLEACDASCVGLTLQDELRLSACGCDQAPDATAEAIALWGARRRCMAATCAAPCLEQDLDCIEKVTRPPALQDPILYRLVAYSFADRMAVSGATAKACALTDPDCTNPRVAPTQLDNQGVAEFPMVYQSTFEPFANHLEVVVDGYRNLLFEVPPIAQNLTVWWPVSSLPKLVNLLSSLGISAGDASTDSFLVVIASDCSGRTLPGLKIGGSLMAEAGGSVTPLVPHYPASASTSETGSIGIAIFTNVPPGPVQIETTLRGRFHSNVQALVVGGGSTLVGLAPTPKPLPAQASR